MKARLEMASFSNNEAERMCDCQGRKPTPFAPFTKFPQRSQLGFIMYNIQCTSFDNPLMG